MGEWQKIETAPKDGQWILLCGGCCHGDESDSARMVSAQWTRWLNGRLSDSSGWWQFAWYDGGYYGEYKNPTHWMPLLEPPHD